MTNVAVYTTVYPNVRQYLRDWHKSVRIQSNLDFQLFIGLDMIERGDVEAAIGEHVDAEWLEMRPGSSIGEVRQQALSHIVDHADIIVLVDSDDVLLPGRIAAGLQSLSNSEVNACALEYMSQDGERLGTKLSLPSGVDAHSILPRWNIFGLSNTTWRAELLRSCLPVLPQVDLVDWYLVTRAWLRGASFSFDTSVRMLYRQHTQNTARVRPPYTFEQVEKDTDRVRKHFQVLLENPTAGALSERSRRVEEVADDVELFYQKISTDSGFLLRYLRELNDTDCGKYWWESVAHPDLSPMWQGANV